MMYNKEMLIGFEMTVQMLRIAGWDAACSLLGEAASKAEARGIYRALCQNANCRTLA